MILPTIASTAALLGMVCAMPAGGTQKAGKSRTKALKTSIFSLIVISVNSSLKRNFNIRH